MKKRLLGALLAVMSAPLVAQTHSGISEVLAKRLASFEHSCGNFEQLQHDSDGVLVERSRGGFCLLRPDAFLWEVREPSAQKIVLNSDFLWHYDADLDTATRYPATRQGQLAPMQLLGGEASELSDNFSITQGADQSRYQLTPLQAQAAFKQVELGFTQDELSSMTITDNLDQQVVIRFTGINHQAELSRADFDFTPPAKADIFYRD